MSTPSRRACGCLARYAALGLAAIFSAGAAAQAPGQAPADAPTLHRWTDADGNVFFSDRPPEAGEAAEYDGPSPPTMRQVYRAQRQAERLRQAEERERARLEAERAAALEATAPKDKIYSDYTCEQAREFAAYYADEKQEFFTRDADGNFVRSTLDQVRATRAQWLDAADTLCDTDAEILPKSAAEKPPTAPGG